MLNCPFYSLWLFSSFLDLGNDEQSCCKPHGTYLFLHMSMWFSELCVQEWKYYVCVIANLIGSATLLSRCLYPCTLWKQCKEAFDGPTFHPQGMVSGCNLEIPLDFSWDRVIFFTTLLNYNSHTIHTFKVYTSVHAQSCAPVTHSILDYFHHPWRNPMSVHSHLFFPIHNLSLALGNCYSTFHLYRFHYSEHFM